MKCRIYQFPLLFLFRCRNYWLLSLVYFWCVLFKSAWLFTLCHAIRMLWLIILVRLVITGKHQELAVFTRVSPSGLSPYFQYLGLIFSRNNRALDKQLCSCTGYWQFEITNARDYILFLQYCKCWNSSKLQGLSSYDFESWAINNRTT